MSSFVLHNASPILVSTMGNGGQQMGRIHSFIRPAGGRAGRRYARERLSSRGRANPGGLMRALPLRSSTIVARASLSLFFDLGLFLFGEWSFSTLSFERCCGGWRGIRGVFSFESSGPYPMMACGNNMWPLPDDIVGDIQSFIIACLGRSHMGWLPSWR